MKDRITKGINYLYNNQQKDGSFSNTQSIFPTALITICLQPLKDHPKVRKMLAKSVKYLLTQKSTYWSFNYWKRGSQKSKTDPYPDDLDDTFCALTAIYLNKPDLLDGKALAEITTSLTATETQEGGPYNTWLSKGPKWKDVDVAVNSNIGYFLRLLGISLPNLEKFIQNSKPTSPFYYSKYPVLYFASKVTPVSLPQSGPKNTLETALLLSSFLNLDKSPSRKLISFLLKNPWDNYPFVVEKITKEDTCYLGSKELTTAFCLEALTRYQNSKKATSKSNDLLTIHNLVCENTKKLLGKLPPPPKNLGEKVTTLPYTFKKALGKNAQGISKDIIIQLGAANLLGWAAYTIYDNIWDEGKDTQLLPLANIYRTELTNIFLRFLPADFFKKIMHKMDKANLGASDFKDLTIIAEKSLGHALGPLAILFMLEFDENSMEIKKTIQFFKHFLTAKQLNDDAHDWEQDLEKGFVTPVTALLPKKGSLLDLRQHFWENTIFEISTQIEKHIRLAQKALSENPAIIHPQYLEDLLTPIEQAAHKACHESRETLAFIHGYS